MFIKKISSRAARRGFSLIELLLVLTLAPIIFFAVYSNFISGVRLWQRMQVGTPEEDQAIFRMKTQRDFQNVLRYAAIPFAGEKDGVSFMAGIEADDKLGGKRAIGWVHYFYDESADAVTREVKDFNQIYRESAGKATQMARGVGSFTVVYLVKEALSSDYEWKEEFRPEKPGELPLAVRLIYTTQNSAESTTQTYFIPAGGSIA